MSGYWHEGAHECDEATYLAFVNWAAKQTKLKRSVAQMCEPPSELFYDLSIPYTPGECPDIICGAELVSEWPELGIIDPRQVDQRPQPWWSENCKVRKDWWERYSAAQGGGK